MKKYQQIEVSAFRLRVTIVSGERPQEIFDAQPAPTEKGLLLNDIDSCGSVAPNTPEGQVILVEAVRRLSPEARATICAGQNTPGPNRSYEGFYLKLRSFYELICPKNSRFTGKEK